MGPIVVTAIAFKSGRRLIKVSDCNGSQKAAERIMSVERTANTGKHAESYIDDWQAAVYPDLPAARSGVMSDFGIDWFNIARKELDNPPVALGMGAPPRS